MKRNFLLCVLSALYCLYFPAAAQEQRYRADSEQLKQSITDGAGELERFAAILQRIRAKGNTAKSSAAGDN